MIEGRHEQRRRIRRLSSIRKVTHDARDGQGRAGTLEFDIDHHLPGYDLEHLVQRWNSLPLTGIEASECGKAHFAHPAGAIRRAIHAFVVDDHDLGPCHPDIELHAVDAEFHGAGESGEGVLGAKARRATMSNDQQAFDVRAAPLPTAGSQVVCGNMLTIMSYLVLARKYRPRVFADVVGQEHVVRTLSNALESERLHHAYLFTGTRGVGKTTLGRILAACFNCETGVTSTPCGECEPCKGIAAGRFMDLMEVDAASQTGVDHTRELLASADLAPAQGRYKVYLIDEVHMLTGHSFNALLKKLEEPPEHVKFLLATTEAKKIPVTVLSRCLQFNLKNMLPKVIEAQLAKILTAEDITADEPALVIIARAARGSMRDALSIADQAVSHGGGVITTQSVNEMLGIAGRDEVGALLDALVARDSERLLATGDELASRSLDLAGVLDELQRGFHDLAVAEELKSAPGNGFGRFRGAFSAEDLQLYYQIALMGRRDIEFAPDPKVGFDMTLLRLASFEPDGNAGELDELTETVGERSSAANAEGLDPAREESGAAVRIDHECANDVASAEGVRDPDDWWEVVSAMAPQGVTAMILKNSNLTDRGTEGWLIRLDQSHESLLNDKQRAEIGRLATAYVGRELRVDFEIGQLGTETPMAREFRIAKETREKATATLMEDPIVQAMLDEFGGTLDSAGLSDGAGKTEPLQ